MSVKSGGDHKGDDLPLEIPDVYATRKTRCPVCTSEYASLTASEHSLRGSTAAKCTFCGFWYTEMYDTPADDDSTWDENVFECSILRRFHLASELVALEELGTHLQRSRADMFVVPPRRFEELIAHAYRNLGYAVELTKQSRDGGVDMYLLDKGGAQLIVECKRYAATRAVTIGVVQRLMGVQLQRSIGRAMLVSTSRFTQPAVQAAAELSRSQSGYEMTLMDAGELIASVGCYNVALPPLNVALEFLDPRDTA